MKLDLNLKNLSQLKSQVQIPCYDISSLQIGHLHIGVGNFHRAHQAYYTEKLLEQSFGPWGIVGISLNSKNLVEPLSQQDGLYTLKTHSRSESQRQIVGCLRQLLYLEQDRQLLQAYFESPQVHIVTLTITEKGYHFVAGSKTINWDSAAIKGDLLNKSLPKTAIGVLAQGLWQRFQATKSPISLLSCDNISGNGDLLESVVTEFIWQAYPDKLFHKWLREFVSFPNSVVDRIVPSIDRAQVKKILEGLDYNDKCPLQTEQYSSWVIEDRFASLRPDWHKVGVQFVADTRVYEKMKLSLLNATHSYLAYFGSIKSYQFVNEAIGDAEILTDVQSLLNEELAGYIQLPKDFSLENYSKSLLDRYKNPNLQHSLLQISMDGTVKLPMRWLPSIDYNLKNNKPIWALSKSVAAWIVFCKLSHKGLWDLQDPMRASLQKLAGQDLSAFDFTSALSQVFPVGILENKKWREALETSYSDLKERFLL